MDQEDVCIVVISACYKIYKMLVHQNFHIVFLELLVKNVPRFNFFSDADQTELQLDSINILIYRTSSFIDHQLCMKNCFSVKDCDMVTHTQLFICLSVAFLT